MHTGHKNKNYTYTMLCTNKLVHCMVNYNTLDTVQEERDLGRSWILLTLH